MLTIKHLLIFKEVARTQSMSKAAENLYISQPTISQKIQEIENYYNIKLFSRYSKKLGISEEGKIFLDHANKILMEMETIDDLFFHNQQKISLRVGSTLTVGSTVTPRLVASLQSKYPNISIQGYVDNTQKIASMLLDNELDIAIVEGEIHHENIIKEPIIPDQLVLVCAPSHPFAKKDLISLEELYNAPFIVREKGSGTRAMLEQFLLLHKIPYQVTWQCHSWDSIKETVLQGHGITLISIHLIEKEIETGLLHVIRIKNWSWNRMFALCYHKDKFWTDNLEIFRQEAIHYISCPLLDAKKRQ